jgi:hypothetical protein
MIWEVDFNSPKGLRIKIKSKTKPVRKKWLHN